MRCTYPAGEQSSLKTRVGSCIVLGSRPARCEAAGGQDGRTAPALSGHRAGTGGSGGAAAVAEGSLEPSPPCQVPSPPPGVAGEAAAGGWEGCGLMT